MMQPAEYNITILRGATFELPFSIFDDGGLVNFQNTYDGARMQIRPKFLHVPDPLAPPAAPILELTTANGMLVIADTVCTINIPASVTAALTAKAGVYDLEFYAGTAGAGQIVDKALFGTVNVGGEATV
jgi:hypothetical protein